MCVSVEQLIERKGDMEKGDRKRNAVSGWVPGPVPKMMPGQEPYSDEEWAYVSKWIHDAAAGDPGEDREPDVLRERDKKHGRD